MYHYIEVFQTRVHDYCASERAATGIEAACGSAATVSAWNENCDDVDRGCSVTS